MSDFEVEIAGFFPDYLVTARSAAGETQAVSVQFPFDEFALKGQLQALELALLRSAATNMRARTSFVEQPAIVFGRQLFEFAFPHEVRSQLVVSRQLAAEQGTSLRVLLRITARELAGLPWEFLFDAGEDDFLCLSTPLVRYLVAPHPRRPLTTTPPLRILAMVARPDELDSLDVDHETRQLTESLAGLEAGGQAQLSWLQGQTWWDLQNALDEGDWHIFHFIGHGAYDDVTGEGAVAFATEDGGIHQIGARELARLLTEKSSLRLVLLNSCETARATADDFSSTASVLMHSGIPAVVAMQYLISDSAAIAFARGFYTALAAQHPVDQAATRARRAVKVARRNSLEWATPVIYLASHSGALFDLTAMSDDITAPLVFLCHSSGDKERVRSLYRKLKADKIRCWFDEEDLLPGQDWEYEITRAIGRSKLVLACVSKASVTKSGYVQKELKKALDVADEQPEGVVYLMPVRLEECEMPERLRRWQWVDLFKDDGYDRLVRGLRALPT